MSLRPHTRCITMITGRTKLDFVNIVNLAALMTLSGCSWMNPFQWFKRDLACGPNDPASELNVACAKEKPKRSEEEKQRLICMSDGTEDGWVCGESVDEALSELAKQNPDVLGRTLGEVSTSDPASGSIAATLQSSRIFSESERSLVPGEIVIAPQLSNRSSRLDETSNTTDRSSPDNERERAPTLEANDAVSTNGPTDVWVVGSFKSQPLAERFAAGFDRAFDLRTTILESDQDAEGNTWFRVSIERPGSEAARASLRQALEELGLERPWRLVINRSQAQAFPTMIDAIEAMSKADSFSSIASSPEPVENEIITQTFAAGSVPIERPRAKVDTSLPEPSVTSPSKSDQSMDLAELPVAPDTAAKAETKRMFAPPSGSSTLRGSENDASDLIDPELTPTLPAAWQNTSQVAGPSEVIDQRPMNDEGSLDSRSAPISKPYAEQPVIQSDDLASSATPSPQAVQGFESADLSSSGIEADAALLFSSPNEQASSTDPMMGLENEPEIRQSMNKALAPKPLAIDKQTLETPVSSLIALNTGRSNIENIDDEVSDQILSESVGALEFIDKSPEVDSGIAEYIEALEPSPSNSPRTSDLKAATSTEHNLGATDPRSEESPGQQVLTVPREHFETDESDLTGSMKNSVNGRNRSTSKSDFTVTATQIEGNQPSSSERLLPVAPAGVGSEKSRIEGPISQAPTNVLELYLQDEVSTAQLNNAGLIAAGPERQVISTVSGDIEQNEKQSSMRFEDPLSASRNVATKTNVSRMEAPDESVSPTQKIGVNETLVASASLPSRATRANARTENVRPLGDSAVESNPSSSSGTSPTEVASRGTPATPAPKNALSTEPTNIAINATSPTVVPLVGSPLPALSQAISGSLNSPPPELERDIANRIQPARSVAPADFTSARKPDSKANLRLSAARSTLEDDPIQLPSAQGNQPALSQRALQSGAVLSAVRSGTSPRTDPVYQQFMDKDPRDFAVQLKAERVLEDIRVFAQSVEMEEPTILKIKPFKAPIYVLILDTFSDFELASEAKNDWMTKQDNDIEPWIRTVESLQKVLEPMGPNDQ